VSSMTIGADRPPGAVGYDELVTDARSALKIALRAAGDLAIVGYTSGTTGLPKGAMISPRALTDCVRLMPSPGRLKDLIMEFRVSVEAFDDLMEGG
jgi:fatty-acyl-CoA synthase